jgi:magnesium transporter
MGPSESHPFPPDYDDVLAIRAMLKVGPREELSARLAGYHPSDLADVLADFDAAEKAALFSLLAPERAADVLAHLDPTSREELLEVLPSRDLHKVLDELEPDEAADVVGDLAPQEAARALKGLQDQHEIESLLEYAPDTAGGLMTTEFVVLPPDISARQAIERARGASETTHRDTLYVTDAGGRPVGRVGLARLVFSPPDALVRDILQPDVHAVPTDMDREQVAEIVRRYDLLSVPVVEPATGRVAGIITVDDVLDAAADEAAEDLRRIAGVGAADPLRQPIWRRAALRLPWLVLTLGPGFLVGQIIRWLGYNPGGETALLLFVPVMIEMAGNVSLQSSTVMVRGLATGEVRTHRAVSILRNEIAVAGLVGVACGVISGAVGYLFFGGQAHFALVVALSMLCGILSAAVSGTLVPLACHAIGVDPALASGPFVTSLNDITGTLIYLGLGGGLLRALG